MERPRMRLAGAVLGSGDPVAHAQFYARLLGWSVTDQEVAGTAAVAGEVDGWAMVRPASREQKLEFQYEPGYTPPVWPPVAGAQRMLVHLDIGVPDVDAAVAWAQECGAHLADHQPQEAVRVMVDPAGHLFCLFPERG